MIKKKAASRIRLHCYGPKYNFNEAKHRFLHDYHTKIINLQ